jgi:hypothetical protein
VNCLITVFLGVTQRDCPSFPKFIAIKNDRCSPDVFEEAVEVLSERGLARSREAGQPEDGSIVIRERHISG